jgi:hypothetical protein
MPPDKPLDKAFSLQYSNAVFHAEIAQLVEHRTENPGVPGSIPGLGTIRLMEGVTWNQRNPFFHYGGAQLRTMRKRQRTRKVNTGRSSFGFGLQL